MTATNRRRDPTRGQVGQQLVEVAAGPGGVDATGEVGELVEGESSLARVAAEGVDHRLAILIANAYIAGLHHWDSLHLVAMPVGGCDPVHDGTDKFGWGSTTLPTSR